MKDKKPHPRSVKGFCERNGICAATFYNLVKRGEIEITKIGARTIITPDQEQDFLKRCSAGGLQPKNSAA